jgi:predicted O-linked N-acetylglucosamine transferase (SPINDLY family)
MFSAWMDILRRTSDSVLWLYVGGDTSALNGAQFLAQDSRGTSPPPTATTASASAADSAAHRKSTTDAIIRNICAFAEAAGIAPQRLVFAQRMNKPMHLARHRLAHLFLDTRY